MASSKNSGNLRKRPGTRQVRRTTSYSETNRYRTSTGRTAERERNMRYRTYSESRYRTPYISPVPSNNNKSAERTAVKKKKKISLFKRGDIDYTLLFLVILIVAIGLIMMLSASAPAGKSLHDDSYYFFKRQLLFIVVGFVGMYVISRINLDNFTRYVPKAFFICVVLLVLVLIPGIGVKVNGARRWLNIPGIQLQPSEFMKPVIAMYIAFMVQNGKLDLKKLKDNIKCLGYVAVVAALLMMETHLSGTLVIVGIAGCVMIAAGTPIKPIILGGVLLSALVFVYLQFDEVRMERLTSFLDPFAYSQDEGYQVTQSIYAIGSGRLFGLGLGQSVQKYSHLPEPYNDFIFAIVCEELGFVGAVIIIILFAALVTRAARIAVAAPDVWSCLTCIGIASQLGIQTFLNIGVATSLIPNTGVSLPFFSYGGTSIMTLLLEMGILLNISRKSVKQ